jgi:hypothetical protein
MRFLLLSRWARSLAIVGVYLLSLQSMGIGRLAYASAAEACCCHARSATCHCPVCSHARAMESGKPFMQPCGVSADPVAIIALDLTLPAVLAAPQARPLAAPPRATPPSFIEAPPREVPTPPPLA